MLLITMFRFSNTLSLLSDNKFIVFFLREIVYFLQILPLNSPLLFNTLAVKQIYKHVMLPMCKAVNSFTSDSYTDLECIK